LLITAKVERNSLTTMCILEPVDEHNRIKSIELQKIDGKKLADEIFDPSVYEDLSILFKPKYNESEEKTESKSKDVEKKLNLLRTQKKIILLNKKKIILLNKKKKFLI
jgi:hypothetical protein